MPAGTKISDIGKGVDRVNTDAKHLNKYMNKHKLHNVKIVMDALRLLYISVHKFALFNIPNDIIKGGRGGSGEANVDVHMHKWKPNNINNIELISPAALYRIEKTTEDKLKQIVARVMMQPYAIHILNAIRSLWKGVINTPVATTKHLIGRHFDNISRAVTILSKLNLNFIEHNVSIYLSICHIISHCNLLCAKYLDIRHNISNNATIDNVVAIITNLHEDKYELYPKTINELYLVFKIVGRSLIMDHRRENWADVLNDCGAIRNSFLNIIKGVHVPHKQEFNTLWENSGDIVRLSEWASDTVEHDKRIQWVYKSIQNLRRATPLQSTKPINRWDNRYNNNISDPPTEVSVDTLPMKPARRRWNQRLSTSIPKIPEIPNILEDYMHNSAIRNMYAHSPADDIDIAMENNIAEFIHQANMPDSGDIEYESDSG